MEWCDGCGEGGLRSGVCVTGVRSVEGEVVGTVTSVKCVSDDGGVE